MARVKKYISIFFKIGIITGLLFGLLMSLKIGLGPGIEAGIMFGIRFSIMMAIIFIPIDYFLTRKLPNEALDIHQNREFHIKGDFNKIFDDCVDTINKFDFIQSIITSKNINSISARTKKSNSSFGEEVTLKFIPLKNGIVQINITSNPIFKYTLLDFGKNFRNIDNVTKVILNKFKSINNATLTE